MIKMTMHYATYSQVSNKREGWNKRAGCFFFENIIICNNKSCSQCSSSMCLFRENRINKQMGQNPKINKRAGENRSKHRGAKF